MRIGLVVTGGVDRTGRDRVVPALLWLIERLARRHDLHVFALHHEPQPATYALLGATIHDLGRVEGPPGLRTVRLRAKLGGAVDAHGPFDALHAYWGMPPGVVTTLVAHRRKIPTVVSFGSGEFVRIDDIGYGLQRRWTDRRAIAMALSRANRVTVASEFMARLVARHGRRPDIVPVGIDPRDFPLRPRAVGPPWRLLRVASLNRVKDYPMLLHALRLVVDRIAAVHLDIVGEDTLGGTIHAMAGTLGLESHVTFHGFQPTERLASFYAQAHLHIVSSRHEAASIAVLEAACAGVPTVGTNVGFVADWSPERAVAVPVGDAAALAGAIVDLLGDGDRRTRIAEAARAWTSAHDADWTAAQFDRIYAELAR